jgi:uroporphyrin-III C-methyltransferase
MDALAVHGIACRICPGVTAASAAAASAHISLSLRGLARRVQFVTAHARAGEPLDLDWSALADPGATLAIYMGKQAARDVQRQLIAAGMAPSTPVLAVESASLPEERILSTRLDLLGISAQGLGAGPALLLIGEAVRTGAARRSSHGVVSAKAKSGH